MKTSSAILLVTFSLLLVAMAVSNLLLKAEYDKIDKSDLYWNYGTVLNKPFHHVKVMDGSPTIIAFEQHNKYSIRVFKNWRGFEEKRVDARVVNDTLLIRFLRSAQDQYEKEYMQRATLVRVFAPELQSVQGFNINFRILKSMQKKFFINVSGRSTVEVESYVHDFDSIHVKQTDSSKVVFRMSSDLKTTDGKRIASIVNERIATRKLIVDLMNNQMDLVNAGGEKNWENLHIKFLDATVQGVSLLDVGHAQVDSLRLAISDTSAIIISGEGLKKFTER